MLLSSTSTTTNGPPSWHMDPGELTFSVRKFSTKLNDEKKPRWHFQLALSPEPMRNEDSIRICNVWDHTKSYRQGKSQIEPNSKRTLKNTRKKFFGQRLGTEAAFVGGTGWKSLTRNIIVAQLLRFAQRHWLGIRKLRSAFAPVGLTAGRLV